MGVILLIVAVVLFGLLAPFGIITALWQAIYKRKIKGFLNKINEWCMELAISLDRLGNVFCFELFNIILIKDRSYPFGDSKETVSKVMAENKENLTAFGKGLYWLIDFIDEGHFDKEL